MATHALLVYPEFPNTYWNFRYALPFAHKRSAFPPLGLMTIAPMLPKDWEKRLVDLNVTGLSDSDLQWADLVMISAMIVQKDSMLQVISRAKEFGKKVVVGGPFVSTTEEGAGDVDHIFVGESELTLPVFLREFEAGTAKRVYKNPTRPDLTQTPAP